MLPGAHREQPGSDPDVNKPMVVLNTAVSRDLVAADTLQTARAERIAIIHMLVVAIG